MFNVKNNITPKELLDQIKNIQQTLIDCINDDCSHCEYREYKNDQFLNCKKQKDINTYRIISLYKKLLDSYEDYRQNM